MTKLHLLFSLVAISLAGCAAPSSTVAPSRVTTSFDASWRFSKGDAKGAEQPAFSDAAWRQLDVPHDWSIEGPFDEKNPTGGAGGFLPGGVAWYRKHFSLPASYAGKRVFIEFDGVMQNSDVWLNGHLLGHRPNGYVSFRYELTDQLQFGDAQDNVLAVRTDTSAQPASRWYSGAGIYRHVRLTVTDPVHVEPSATFVTADQFAKLTFDEDPKRNLPPGTPMVHVQVQTQVRNQSAAARETLLRISLIDPTGKTVASATTPAKSIGAGDSQSFQQDFQLAQPLLWNLDHPQLYHALVEVSSGGNTLDTDTVTFGIRDAHFESATGFWLNGKNLKLYGVCLHHEGGAFGAAVPLAIWEQRLTELRKLGVNAIRTAHNPPDPGFLDLCDRMGFLVMDELFDCWEVAKNPYDYHLFFDEWANIDVRDTVRRDRNHPSVILYSAGNEIHDTPKEEKAKQILAGLVAVFHENDPTRPVTQALFRPNVSHDYTNGLADMLDVIGTNYRDAELIAAWQAKPGRMIVGTEQRHDRETWLELRDHPQHAGQFLWTGVDYLGESRAWPTVAAGAGLIDRTGALKPIGMERDSWWNPRPIVHVVRRIAPTQRGPVDPGFAPLARRQVQFADWSPANREPHEENVEVYSNAESVELFLNDQSLGAKSLNADASARTWKVGFAPGALRAVAKNQNVIVATNELRTAGTPARILLSANRATISPSFEDVAVITARVVDAQGETVPAATDLISFSVQGPGAVVAVDNADSASHEPFQASSRRAFQGRSVAFVKAAAAAGSITVSATASGLERGAITIETGNVR